MMGCLLIKGKNKKNRKKPKNDTGLTTKRKTEK